MDRYRYARTDAKDGLCRSGWIEMAPAEPRAPTPHRKERQVHKSSEVRHLGKEIGVPGEVHTRRSVDAIAERFGDRTEETAPPIVDGLDRLDLNRADGEPFARRDLDRVVARPGHETTKPPRDDDARPASQPPQGTKIQVVVMAVGDDDCIDLDVVDEVSDRRGVTMEWAETIHEEGIGEDPRAVELKEHGGMAQIPHAGAHEPSLMRRS